MRRALELAREGIGTARPNPCVGAVLVRDGEVIAEGRTQPQGNHAEKEALAKCADPRGATLFVTLEPCCHTEKRTPPCTDALIAAGIARVVVGMRDPNPLVDGKGIAALKAQGIDVVEGMLADECREVHAAFAKWIVTRRPFVTLKIACTLDGKVAWEDGARKNISNDQAWRRVHELRREHDAVLVGVGTVLRDDPLLTVRLVQGINPVRVVLDGKLRTPAGAKALNGDAKTIIFCEEGASGEVSADVVRIGVKDGQLDVAEALDVLGELGITSVLVEAGPSVAASFIDGGLVDRFLLIIAPFTMPGGRTWWERCTRRFSFVGVDVERLGEDLLLSGTLKYEQD